MGIDPKINTKFHKISFRKKYNHLKNYLYILPAALLVVIFFISSIIFTFIISFTDWSGMGPLHFIGIGNYIHIFSDVNFITSFLNTLAWAASSLILPVLIAFILAIGIVKSTYATFFKNLFYFSNTISATIAAIIMTTLLSMDGLPQLFGKIGLTFLDKSWLNIPYTNTLVMIIASVWQGIGMNLILFIVGLNNISTEPIEAARIDGASGFKLYTKVIIPLLKPTILVVILMSLVNSFKTFDIIWIMTNGGPYRTSETLAVTMYTEAFVNNNMGYGSAIAIFLTIIVLLISYFYLKNTFKGDESET